MNRWWDDFDKASDIAVRLNNKDDPEMAVGTALLVLHTIGKAAYDAAAHSLDPTNGFLDAPHAISNEVLVGAVCKAFDDASGIPGYGATRVAFIKGEADAGARTLAASLRQEQMPWPLVCKHVGETYGLPSSRVVPIRKAMGNSHELITGLAADRALLKWAASIAKAEVQFSKAEKDTFTVKGKERTVHRNEKGEFVSPGSKTAAYMEEKKRQKAKQPKRKKEQIQEQEQEEKKESPDWGRSAEVKTKQEKEAERKAELEMRSERAARGSHGEVAFQERIAEQRASIAAQAAAGYKAAQGFEARRAAAREAARQGIGQYRGRAQAKEQVQQAQQRGEAKQPARAQRQKPQSKEEQRQAEVLRIFDEADPSATTKIMMIDTGNVQTPVKVPQMYMVNQLPEDEEMDQDAVISMYTGIPQDELDDKAEYLDERLGNTIAWLELMDRSGGGLEFLKEDPSLRTRGENKYQIEELHDAIDKFYESDEKKSIKNHTEFLDTVTFQGSNSDKHEFIQNVIGDITDHISHEMSTADFLDMLHEHADNKETVDSLIRALQIREMTATPDQFLPTTSITIQPKNYHMLLNVMNTDTGEYGRVPEVLDDNLRASWGTVIDQLLSDEDNEDAVGGSDFRIEAASIDRDTPHALRIFLNNHGGRSFNDSGVLDTNKIDAWSGGADVPISPSSPIKESLLPHSYIGRSDPNVLGNRAIAYSSHLRSILNRPRE